ncbi:hypothetical protein HGI30_16695 [Paenibacillus albicereus]|uniref:Uncharacterized protein n=1 Tax=Paenibacillus albicereus TaxID=2726185 RepID=A0A6H2H0C4_9BACL|nr:hypothetical protein [Paenibacillus albicereus]QJC53049.1 hypothetical protein HGI30_16695 [Paenibacillus albicereus]
MPNRYANLDGNAKISESYTQINDGFTTVQSDIDSHKAAATLDHPDGSVTTAKLAGKAVTQAKLGDKAVGSGQLADAAVGTGQLADGSVTTAKIAGKAVGAAQVADKAIGSGQLADSAVGTTQIAAKAVTQAKLGDAAVGTTQLADGAVTAAKVAADVATQAELDAHVNDTVPHISAAERSKLTGIQTGAEVNQNAFAKVNDVPANAKSDTLTIEGGTGITITTDAANKKVLVTATGTATPGAHASSHITGGTDVIPNVTGSSSGLMSPVDKSKLDGTASAATPSTIMQRDANGRAKIAAPAAADDIARKDTVDAAVAPLTADLADAALESLALVPGQQVVSPTRPAPLRVKSIKGRTLVNLLGRDGGFEAGVPTTWSATYGTMSSETGNVASGAKALRVTLASAAASAATNRFLPADNKCYVFIAMLKCGTNSSMQAVISGNQGTLVTKKDEFAPSFIRFKAASSGVPSITVDGANGQYGYVDGVRLYEITQAEYDAIAGQLADQVAAKYPYVDDVKNVNGVYIRNIPVVGDPDKDQYVFYPDCQLAANMDGSIYDELYTDADGRARVKRRFRTMDLTGEMAWGFAGSPSGYKTFGVSIPAPINDTAFVVKYDGKILGRVLSGAGFSAADQQVISGVYNGTTYNTVSISVSNNDSGWGDSYTPTADEIKAYFNGWVMFNGGAASNSTPDNPANNLYNGSGQKAWARRSGGVGRTWVDGTVSLPMTLAPSFTTYRLQYQLAEAVDEPTRSEGAILLTTGANSLEVGAGAIVRESARPAIVSGAAYIFANNQAYRNQRVIQTYKNSRPSGWTIATRAAGDSGNAAYGLQYAVTDPSNYDPSAVYEVTYLALDVHQIGLPPTQIVAEYAANLRTVADDASKAAVQLARRVSVLENGSAQAKQPQWITPTLLNGTQNFSDGFNAISYMKDALGFVHIKGFAANPSNIAMFRLPPGYRPAKNLVFASTSASSAAGANPLAATINVQANGTVQAAINAQAGFMTLDGIAFQAEL